MKKTISWLSWVSIGWVAVLVALNWPVMIEPSLVNLVFTEVRVPLGLSVLAISAIPLALIFVAHLRQQIGTLIETRRLLREVQHAHALADQAEASRVEGLRQLLAEQFRVVNERLDSLGAAAAIDEPVVASAPRRRILSGPWRAK